VTASPLLEAVQAARRNIDAEQAKREQREAYQSDPVGFCRQVLRFEPWSKQREILESVRDNTRTAVRSGHGVGKTATAACAALWFLATHPQSRVITTALTWSQVRMQLWKEIREAHRLSQGAVGGKPLETRLELGDKWYALGLSTDTPEAFHGHHADHLLLVVDEASGVSEGIFEAATGYMTAEGARLLLIGNPTQLAGTFYRAFHEERAMWNTIAVSLFDTPAFTGEDVSAETLRALPGKTWPEDMRALYGEESPAYQVRVLGQFSSISDDTVIDLAAIEEAQRRECDPSGPVVVACDVARFGSDRTTIALRRGSHIRIVHASSGQDTMRTVGEIKGVLRSLEANAPQLDFPIVVIDDTGVGGGVTDRLRELDQQGGLPKTRRIVAHQAGGRPHQRGDYPNRRSELWFAFGERLPELDLDEADNELLADLVATKYTVDSSDRLVVEPKEKTKQRLARSPDRADAVLMTFATDRFERVPMKPPGKVKRFDGITTSMRYGQSL
jgi:phage terminase large subunit